jgi:hypothetical protein
LVVTVTKSDAGAYTGKLDSLDQGATLPIDTITVNGDAVRWEIKSSAIVFEGALNKERTELAGTFTQADQPFPAHLKAQRAGSWGVAYAYAPYAKAEARLLRAR